MHGLSLRPPNIVAPITADPHHIPVHAAPKIIFRVKPREVRSLPSSLLERRQNRRHRVRLVPLHLIAEHGRHPPIRTRHKPRSHPHGFGNFPFAQHPRRRRRHAAHARPEQAPSAAEEVPALVPRIPAPEARLDAQQHALHVELDEPDVRLPAVDPLARQPTSRAPAAGEERLFGMVLLAAMPQAVSRRKARQRFWTWARYSSQRGVIGSMATSAWAWEAGRSMAQACMPGVISMKRPGLGNPWGWGPKRECCGLGAGGCHSLRWEPGL
ncbi:hypothetical protein BN1723_003865 [Verticillium longisporum]|uniref:Uncharacterized protein n=1 Tax=Verticillium longisporum TaxID=100787 RepID=A0A0G4MD33_VERLO|nr:hypothetical protein BN1723_003865 [Verticillium longisporum]